jgi:hypothetical protein
MACSQKLVTSVLAFVFVVRFFKGFNLIFKFQITLVLQVAAQAEIEIGGNGASVDIKV